MVNLLDVWKTVCVCSAQKQVLPYRSRSKARLLTTMQEPPPFTRSSILTQGLPVCKLMLEHVTLIKKMTTFI